MRPQNPSRGHEEARLLANLGEEGCPVCHDITGTDDHYFFWFFNQDYCEGHTLDGLTRSLGFCLAHGARLTQAQLGSYQLAGVHVVLVRRVRAILLSHRAGRTHGKRRGSPLASYDLCPTCRDREQAAERTAFWLARVLEEPAGADHYARPGMLCFPHLRALSPRLSAPTLERLLAIHRTSMAATMESLKELRAELRRIQSDGRQDLEKALLPSLRLAVGHDAGDGAFPPLNEESRASHGVKDPVGDFLDRLGQGETCPVCLNVREAWIEWIRWLDEAAPRVAAIDDLLPICSEHVWPTVHLGGAFLAVATAEKALSAAVEQVDTAIRILRPAPPKHREPPTVRLRRALWGSSEPHPQRPRLRLRAAREVVARDLGCSVCKRLAVARDRALLLLFALLEDRRHRALVEGGYGLCLKHFSRALALGPSPAVQAVIAEVEAAKLARLEWELEESLRKAGWEVRPEAKGTEQTAWRRAVLRFSGSLAGEMG